MKQFLLIALLLVAGCNKKQTVITATPDVPAIEFGEDKPSVIITKAIEINETIYFDLDRANIRASQVPILDGIVLKAQKAPSKVLVLTGGCCPLGTDEHNQALGLARANACKVYIWQYVKNHIRVVSVGETQLVTTDPEQYELNRRVEIHFE